ncbi:LCP family protein [Falcatimonas sp. MSJ-15]|uniref:LCP family protein n=1 Tax=Falcatimonas sp. MSJ-15 TaxID=2841515 RepID=UPI001C10F02F|nr:LCP family protein [Falcatimonas sp. MSJ-15]MBU5469194.1 LCP family protein [Falcatimonas sp. MSJ-15]
MGNDRDNTRSGQGRSSDRQRQQRQQSRSYSQSGERTSNNRRTRNEYDDDYSYRESSRRVNREDERQSTGRRRVSEDERQSTGRRRVSEDERQSTGRRRVSEDERQSTGRRRVSEDERQSAGRRRVSEDERQRTGRQTATSQRNTKNGQARPKMTKKQMQKKRAKKRKGKIIAFVFELLLLCIIVVFGYSVSKLQKINYNPIAKENILINDVKSDEIKGYTNIALFGVDARDKEPESLIKDAHSDAIIIASINNKTKDVKLISVYRDTCLLSTVPSSSGSDIYRKATETYYFGGPEAAINMLNTNLDMDITDYVTVNFEALIETIDLLGGIDLEIDENEQFYINGYMTETCEITERPYEELTEVGNVHLTGLQATAFCRIRYGGGDDYKRTERQREVLSLMFEKAKKMDVIKLNKLIETVFPMISTSLSSSELISMASSVMSYNLVDTTGFPFDKKTKTISEGDCVFAVSLESNVEKLHEYMFGDTDYKVSDTVNNISNVLINKTGFYPEETTTGQ